MPKTEIIKEKLFSNIAVEAWIIAAFGLVLRLFNLSNSMGAHPDERHIIGVSFDLSIADLNPHSFAYGSFPFYLVALVSRSLGVIAPFFSTYEGFCYVGRIISALFGTLLIVVGYKISRVLGCTRIGQAFVALLVAGNVFLIQLSRFYAVDIILAALCAIFLYYILRMREGDNRSLIGAGVSLGLAVGTKISALSLGLPLFVALMPATMPWTSKAIRRSIGEVMLVCAIGAFIFLSVEPFALLNYSKFFSDLWEQITMVKGVWRPPYTIQYWHTVPYFYPLAQMLFYTMGVPLAVMAFCALLCESIRAFRGKDRDLLVLLSFVLVVFISVGGYQVKFPRYLLPTYVPLFILSTVCIERAWLSSSKVVKICSGAVQLIVAAWVVFYAVGFVQIYRSPHPYITASNWFYANSSRGGVIGIPHWDDGFPMDTVVGRGDEYKKIELPFYESETDENFQRLMGDLSKVDYIVFPTPRIPGSLLRIPEEYPRTTLFLRALYSNELGFSSVFSTKKCPQVGGVLLCDDLADESFSVYDHPRVTIFKNEKKLSVDELNAKLGEMSLRSDLASRDEVLRASRVNEEAMRENSHSIEMLYWYVSILGLGLIALPISLAVFARSVSFAYFMAKILGLSAFALITWFGNRWLNFPFSQDALLALVLSGLVISCLISQVLPYRRRMEGRQVSYEIVQCELFFFVVFCLAVFVKAYNPEIFWGEKPMDFSFLNYFIRLEKLPADDPWAAGHKLDYYYLGSYLYALICKLSGIGSGVGFNLALCSTFSLFILGLFALCRAMSFSLIGSILTALGVGLCSNLDIVKRGYFDRELTSFDLFWASSRTLQQPSINEYPLWSFLFGDLHAHFMAEPFAFGVMLSTLYVVFLSRGWMRYAASAIVGILIGFLLGMNSWDAISCILVIVTCGGVFWLKQACGGKREGKEVAEQFAVHVTCVASCIGGLLLGGIPAFLSFHTKRSIIPFLPNVEEFNGLGSLLLHYGVICVALLLMVAIWAGIKRLQSASWKRCVVGALIAAILPVAAFLGLAMESPSVGLTGPIVLFAMLIGMITYLYCCVRHWRWSVALMSCLCVVMLLLFSEAFVLQDRMNSTFKFGLAAWLMSTISFVFVLGAYIESFRKAVSRNSKIVYGCGLGAVFLLIGCGLVGSELNISIMMRFHRIDGPRPTIDGSAYLANKDGDESMLIGWLNRNVQGTPVIVEAQGDSYGEFGRISMNTGLPVVLGWGYHVMQRGVVESDIERRKEAVSQIYTSSDEETVLRALREFGVRYVVLGNIERAKYASSNANEALFSSSKALTKIFESGSVKLFYVKPTVG